MTFFLMNILITLPSSEILYIWRDSTRINNQANERANAATIEAAVIRGGQNLLVRSISQDDELNNSMHNQAIVSAKRTSCAWKLV